MKLKFALFTWLIAILLNAVFSTIYLSDEAMQTALAGWVEILLVASLVTIFFSLPGFAGIFVWLWIADNFYFSSLRKFICFSIGCLLTTILCYVLLFSILGIQFNDAKIYHLMLLSMLAVLIALMIQRKYFYKVVTPDFEEM